MKLNLSTALLTRHSRRNWIDRFWPKIQKSEGCWKWVGRTDGQGYGVLMIDRRPRNAHRLAWFLHFGPIPNGLHILHKCDNPRCVNPDHLFLGTHADNMRDKVAKGRHLGKANHKLNREQVLAIRSAPKRHRVNVELAEQYGVAIGTIGNLRSGSRKRWADAFPPDAIRSVAP